MSHNHNNNEASEEDSESCSDDYESSELEDNKVNEASDQKHHGKDENAGNHKRNSHACDKNKGRDRIKHRRKDYYCSCNKGDCKSKPKEVSSANSQQKNSASIPKNVPLEFHCNCMTCQESRVDASHYDLNRLKSCEGKVDLLNQNRAGRKCKIINPVDKTVTKRLASAHRDTINGLRGQVNLLEIKIKELQKENSTYKLMQYRQDKALTRYQGEFAELPSLIKSHKDELQSTRHLLKKSENKCRELEETIKVRDKRISKMHDENYKLSSFVNQYDMGNRHKLLTQLKETKAKLKETEKKADESSHYVQVLQRSQQQRMQEENSRNKSIEMTLYKSHMRNVELQKCVEDQAARLRNYESLILKTIRTNNMPVDPEGGIRQQNCIQMHNMYSNRPTTYTLQLEQKEYSEVNENFSGGSSSYCQQPISYGNATTYFPRQDQLCQPLKAIAERNEDNKAQETFFPTQVANNRIINPDQCIQTQFESNTSSILNPIQTYTTYSFSNNDNQIITKNEEVMENKEKGTQCIEIVALPGRSGGDRKSSTSDENCIKKKPPRSCRKKNRYEAGDEASDMYLAANLEEPVEFNNNNCSNDISYTSGYNNDTATEDDKFLQALRAKKEARRCRRNRKMQKIESPSGNSYVKISEEMIEKFVVDSNGRRKKSMSIMKKRKNVYHSNPAQNEPSEIQNENITEMKPSYDLQIIPFEAAAGDSFVADSPMKSICYSQNAELIPVPNCNIISESNSTNELVLMDPTSNDNDAFLELESSYSYSIPNDSKPIIKRFSISR